MKQFSNNPLAKYNVLLIVFALLLYNCSIKEQKISSSRYRINFNQEWKYVKQDSNKATASFYEPSLDDSSWESVSLPHTAHIEPLVITGKQWQGNCLYRKKFTLGFENKDKHIALYFEGAMQVAEIWLNGTKIAEHTGGYLPFYVELTDKVFFDKENVIAVKLNNEDNPQVPPGKPLAGLDFNYYSGLYRNVHLIVKNKIHISDPIQTDIVAGGGVFVETLKADANEAVLKIRTDILNKTETTEYFEVRNTIFNNDGVLITSNTTKHKSINGTKSEFFIEEIKIEKPNLWTPELPKLYTLKIELLKEGRQIDSESIRFGIRSIKFDKKGFYLNGEKYTLRGTNRHQEYPYIGYALSDNAQYRDAYKIKQAGFNFVRLSHYPHSESFMDACDELGILVMDAIPGWQFFGDETFQENCYSDIRQVIRRDRNHPSVVLWEASLNESAMTKAFMTKAHDIVHEELPGDQIYTCGWINYAYDVFIPARQHAKAPDYWKKYVGDRPTFIAEYGDWEYYAQNAGFNQTAYGDLKKNERTSRQLRGDGQIRLAQQALNYQESHNDNLYNSAAGDANWLMFDYNRGYAPDIESSGVMDIFRLPKFSYYFYSSQRELNKEKPVLFIANYWNDPSYNNVKIYSNCDEVELWLNGNLIEKRNPDTDKISTNLKHPPFTFKEVSYLKGKLTAKGYVDGKLVLKTSRTTPETSAKIELLVDTSNKPLEANKNDVVFVYAKIVDANGNYVPTATNKVKFSVTGDAELIGDNPAVSEAGIATVLLKAGKIGGEIKIFANSDGLIEQKIKFQVSK